MCVYVPVCVCVCVLTAQPDAEQHQEGGVIAGPLVFGLFAVVEVAVHFLRRGEQVKHLPHGELKVHVFEVHEAAQVLVALRAGGVPSGIAGVQAAVGLFMWGVRCGGQHTDTHTKIITTRTVRAGDITLLSFHAAVRCLLLLYSLFAYYYYFPYLIAFYAFFCSISTLSFTLYNIYSYCLSFHLTYYLIVIIHCLNIFQL